MNDYKTVPVSFGQMAISQNQTEILIAFGLGSCVAIALYDYRTKIAALFHPLLPENPHSTHHNAPADPLKYVKDGCPMVIAAMVKMGATQRHLTAVVCGGAQMLTAFSNDKELSIGDRNVIATHEILKQFRIPIEKEDTGGTNGRTMKFYPENGRIVVKTMMQENTLFPGYKDIFYEKNSRSG